MQKINITHLLYLEALVEERNVTRAAEIMGVGQPAMSSVLARLRAELDDVLLIKTKTGMEPTEKAAEIVGKFRELKSIIGNKGAAKDVEDLRRVRYEFKIMSSDGVSRLFLPQLINSCEVVAPNIRILMDSKDQRQISDYLGKGDIDLAVSSFGELALDIRKVQLYQQKLMGMTRRNHPAVRERLTVENLAELRHVSWKSSSLPRPRIESILDRSLAQHGIQRNVVVRVPALTAIPELVENSNLVACVPEILARHAALICKVDLWDLPFETESLDISMIWHEKNQQDVVHRWIRNEIVRITEAYRGKGATEAL